MKIMLSKALVFAVIVLFIGAGFVPSISGIYNYKEIASAYGHASENSILGNSGVSYDYIFITTEALEDSVASLKTWKENSGYSVKVVTLSEIKSGYGGNDIQEKIRNFLRDKYIDWGIKYVLIVGSNSVIPMKTAWGDTPTDFYYADLNSDWDCDDDGVYGEPEDDDVDLTAEVIVGRIPLDDPEKVRDYGQKVIRYEIDDGKWKKSALLLGAILFYKNEDHEEHLPKIDGAETMEKVKESLGYGFECTTMYEKEGLSPSVYSCDYPLTHENVISQWKQGYGVVAWFAHGYPKGSVRKIWVTDDGDNIPEFDEGELEWSPLITASDHTELNDAMPSIVFAAACSTASPDVAGNLAQSLIQDGAIAYIGGTHYSAAGEHVLTMFFSAISDGAAVGNAFCDAKEGYNEIWGTNKYFLMYTENLFGDPSLSLYLSDYPPAIPSDPYPDDESSNIDINVTLDWEDCTDPEGKKVVYDIYLKEGEEPSTEDLIASNLAVSSYELTRLKENIHYYWEVVAKDEDGLYRNGPVWSFYTIDTEPPNINITNPQIGYLYISGNQKRETLLGGTGIIGEILIQFSATDNFAIDKIEFYIDNQLKYSDDDGFYYWNWDEKAFGKYNLTAIAYDLAGNTNSHEIDVWKLF